MEKPITDFILKSHIRQLLRNKKNVYGSNIASVDRNDIVSRLWDWIYIPHISDATEAGADTKHLLELLRKGSEICTVEDSGDMYGAIRYEICFPSIKFHLIKLHDRYMVTAAKAPTSVSFSRFRSPEETVAYMNAFNDAMPAIYRYIEEEIAALARNELLASITTSTAKGMIEQIINEEGLDVPKICSIRGTEKGRVILYFEELDEKINCPLDYLRARLIRRFANKRRK